MFLAIAIAFTVFLCIKFRDCNDKTFRIIVFIGWLIITLFEIYKQIIFTLRKGTFEVKYDWGVFPFQLCSTPLYVLPVVAFMKDCKLRDFFTSYVSTFSLVGGLVVMIYPFSVFNDDRLGIHIQTMIHHGIQIALGIWFWVYNRKKADFRYFLKSIPLFLIVCAIAVLLNETLGVYLISVGVKKFNLFYISSHESFVLPILGDVHSLAPWSVILLVYVLSVITIAFILFEIMRGIYLTACKIQEKK